MAPRSVPVAAADQESSWRVFEAEALPHIARLFRLAMWLERNRSAAEDLVQETLTQALQSFHRFTPGTNCRAWLVSILQHVRAKRHRAEGRAPLDIAVEEQEADTLPFVPPIPEHLTDEDLLQALRQIPVAYQEVILLCDVQEMTYKEIAAALNIPIGTVMSRLHRGRDLLRQSLSSASGSERAGAAR
jgi:RNA polymerase sigma-70 factor, ECF subfamily